MQRGTMFTVPGAAQAPGGFGASHLPLRCGVGLKATQFRQVLDELPDVGFFEVHAENFMVPGGPLHHYLGRIREHYPLSIHGVALSIGGEADLDRDHLDRLAELLARYQPHRFSEHLAWSTHGADFLNDLLPLPYTRQTLQRVCDHIDQAQTRLGRSLLLENPATYVAFASSTMTETAFIRAVVARTGCGLLLDVNNIHVSCVNHGLDSHAYLSDLPLDRVGEIHLAGHTQERDSAGAPLLIDSHGAPVAPPVWELYRAALKMTGPVGTLLERDNDLPPLAELLQEAALAEQILQACADEAASAHLRAHRAMPA